MDKINKELNNLNNQSKNKINIDGCPENCNCDICTSKNQEINTCLEKTENDLNFPSNHTVSFKNKEIPEVSLEKDKYNSCCVFNNNNTCLIF